MRSYRVYENIKNTKKIHQMFLKIVGRKNSIDNANISGGGNWKRVVGR